MMNLKKTLLRGLFGLTITIAGCKTPAIVSSITSASLPSTYNGNTDTLSDARLPWRSYFTDQNLVNLIDTALNRNQELGITLQEIEITRNEALARRASLMPIIGIHAGSGVEKAGRYTSQGAGDATTDIEPGKEMPDPLHDYMAQLSASWELDIWNKLHNAKKAAVTRYLATVQGRNFVQSNLIAEVANTYYELLALDNQLDVVQQNIRLQQNGLELVKVQKEAARVTELAVQKFQAEVFHSQSLAFTIRQQITETENRLNLLLGRFPQEIKRNKEAFMSQIPSLIKVGVPTQLLDNRPDIKQAELELTAAKLDVKAARAEFYPSLGISSRLGIQAYKFGYLNKTPESMLYSLAGDLTAPLINRSAIKAEYRMANARQLQAVYNYQQAVLHAYLEVAGGVANISNLEQTYMLRNQTVEALKRSISISNDLFISARADYLEVLMTQRDALDSQLELIETQKARLIAQTQVYKALGGGWK